MSSEICYIDAKARVIRAINRVTTFVKASIEFNNDKASVGKRAKIRQMLTELIEIRRNVENDIQLMETSVGQKTAPSDVTDNTNSNSLIDSFDTLYYELAAFADVHSFSLISKSDSSISNNTTVNQTSNINSFSMFQLPKRTFPTFSGNIVEWQGFEDLFQSILSHAPDLPDVERFEYLKTSLNGEALSLVSHLALTSGNYKSAWALLRARYGNKRDLARIHLVALLKPHGVKWDDSSSIKTAINTILEHTSALDNLEFVTRQWSPILIHIFENRLDYELRARWEHIVGDKHNPQLSEFIDFLRSHVRSAEVHLHNSVTSYNSTKPTVKLSQGITSKPRYGTSQKVLATSSNQPSPVATCPLCKKSHFIRKCQSFLDQGPNERYTIAKNHQLCINCLGFGHTSASCRSKYKCQTCNKSHHTLLHFDSTPTVKPGPVVSSDSPAISFNPTSLVVRGQPKRTVLLSTMLLDVVAHDGSHQSMRALVDSGSQASFITEKSASSLMLRRAHSSVTISTFNSNNCTLVRGRSTITITQSGHLTPSIRVEVLIVPSITEQTPQQPIIPGKWSHIVNLSLADPCYHTPGEIDILLGADILPSLLLDGKVDGQSGEPMAIETVFGWILMGPVDTSANSNALSLCLSISEPLDETLKRFWEVEELPMVHHLSSDDIEAETFYKSTTTRLATGRFMVRLPFRKSCPLLGNSKAIALQRFKALELRLSKNAELGQQYVDFMTDYLTAGHMEIVPPEDIETAHQYYIPHHCVVKPDSKTTKLRVVFNASAQTSNGLSLNDSMFVGPKLQPDIQIVLLRARLWKYVFVADIKQMYRQILIHPDDRDYQRILWRFSSEHPIEEYRLCTVTYGTSAAPFQALRTIRELATVDGVSFPSAATILLNDTFVDDVLSGANSLPEALECQQQLVQLCSRAQFELRKWASNSIEVLHAVSEDSRAMSLSVLFDANENADLKILGLKWDPSSDTFSFKTQLTTKCPTKRSILSDIARVFDPIGLLSPITLWTKTIMQRLWTEGIGWDDPVSSEISQQWSRYESELPLIANLVIRRRLTYDDASSLQLHVFSDSSERGYAAAVYLRVETPTSVHCHLVAGKSKVAPLKRCTIPRLELCGAVLGAKLLTFVVNAYAGRIKINEQHAWTDSTTALVWIQSSPHKWATFIANRTSQIQELTPPSIWRYVPTKLNPVDCASRGLFPSELINHPLWWTGAPYLIEASNKWPPPLVSQPQDITAQSYEAKQPKVLLVTLNSSVKELLERFSSLEKILRIISYCFRITTPRNSSYTSKIITAEETTRALLALIYFTQQLVYADDIVKLSKGLRPSKNLRCLDLFLDKNSIVRVGGRLNNAEIPYAHMHPALLPSSHPLTTLIIDHHHFRLKHPGATALQTHLQRSVWIQSARQAIRSRLRRCISCFRTRPSSVQPKMAALPKYRVQQVKPFAVTGVDYAGPIRVKGSRGRSAHTPLTYICLFVCMTTRALHLELSSDLTSETFLLAFTRFAARRGPIRDMHSDCGTQFVGASRLLTPLQQFTHSQPFQDRLQQHCSKAQITWHFNPPASPHFGGLWEAGVKSVKSLILRTIGSHSLTHEELNTLLTQIEATLNSRPLSAMSNDPNDLEVLTPSHFLTLEPSTSLPEPNLESVQLSKLQRWRLVNDLHRHFWSRWKNEYLGTLQLRRKWTNNAQPLNIDDLVLIREATPPLQWRLGRIRKLFPGYDGVSRVADVQTAAGNLTRPIVKLCPLPSC